MQMWSPWHGCRKISEGCDNCYMYYLDKIRDRDGSVIYKTKNFYLPVERNRKGEYIVPPGSTLSTCMSSDFFLEEADEWRDEAWQMMRERSDVRFFIITKRVHRIKDTLPSDWGDGYDNVDINITCENQKRADERIPILLDLPLKHKSIAASPFIGELHLDKYLATGKIESVSCGGENYEGARPCDYEWVKILREECEKNGVNFCFFETGTHFIKDGKKYFMPSKKIQSQMAHKSGMNYDAFKREFNLCDKMGNPIPQIKPKFHKNCESCGSRTICSGCSSCGKCEK